MACATRIMTEEEVRRGPLRRDLRCTSHDTYLVTYIVYTRRIIHRNIRNILIIIILYTS